MAPWHVSLQAALCAVHFCVPTAHPKALGLPPDAVSSPPHSSSLWGAGSAEPRCAQISKATRPALTLDLYVTVTEPGKCVLGS